MIALSNSFSLIFPGMITLSNLFSNSSFIILLFHPLWKIHPGDSTFSKMYAEKKPDKVDPNELRLSKWPNCMLSNEPLREPFVIDKLGNILNKEAFVEVLLGKKLPKEFGYIKGLKEFWYIKKFGYIRASSMG
ncbi:unnamed protein product [Vicia faba]|uniref:Uncharacterized protein n=1 Tax=Vicia faba TaxID=3906 RepID=A0AAV1APA0_VICFA|nr:unnamed protein product [Vicia faba]